MGVSMGQCLDDTDADDMRVRISLHLGLARDAVDGVADEDTQAGARSDTPGPKHRPASDELRCVGSTFSDLLGRCPRCQAKRPLRFVNASSSIAPPMYTQRGSRR